MNWYEKLNQYFPVEEMKSKEHMDALLKEKGSVYYKDEGPYHVLMYAEFPNFTFVDYLSFRRNHAAWVLAKRRFRC